MLIKDYDAESVTFKVQFEHPLSVSVGDEPDIMRVYFPDPDLFVGANSGLTLEGGEESELQMDLPRQFPDAGTMDSIG